MLASREEEALILQQFLRFGETRSIAQEIILQDTKELQEKYTIQSPKSESEIKKFIERSNVAMQSFMRAYDARQFYASRFTPYPYATSPVAASQAAARMVSPPLLHRFSPPNTNTTEPKVNDPTPTPPPTLGSPLNRLQTMHPFDYRREHRSPMLSPTGSDGSAVGNVSPHTSPQNLTVPSTSATTSPSPSHLPALKQEKPTEAEYYDIKPEDTEEALNFSTKDNPSPQITHHHHQQQIVPPPPPQHQPQHQHHVTPTVSEPQITNRDSYEAKRAHTRKANTPIKRHWQPTGAFGSTFMSPSGKKRVICTACNKTFCDKGALKIHYSAVHLKEMHKCTVEGCNMVFSSRRSRNRHSANPNPKLHMPQNRRKLPDGARVIDDGKGNNPSITPLVNMPHRRPTSPGEITPGHTPVMPLPEHNIASPQKHHIMPIDMPAGPPPSEQRYFLQPARDPDAVMDSPADLSCVDEDGSNTSPISLGTDEKAETAMGGRSKRKSMMPTRCAQMDDSFPMSDDNNSHDGSNFKESKDTSIDDPSRDNSRDSGHYLEPGEALPVEGEEGDDLEDLSDSGQPLPESEEEYEGPQDLTVDTKRNGEKSNNEQQHFLGLGLDAKPPDDPECDEPEEGEIVNGTVIGESIDSDDSMDLDGVDIPLDTENPKKCPACGKIFQNHFTVKTHYQNVHLKLMHTCSIEGCNAAFPSKRSRDRHSSNLNLHRKLLSTSSDGSNLMNTVINQSLRDEFLPKIYENYCTNQNGITQTEEHSAYRQDLNGSSDDGQIMNGDFSENVSGSESDEVQEKKSHNSMVECHVCQELFRDNLALKEHFETTHPRETYRCTIMGCDKIFSTRKSRNRHSQNDALHKHIAPEQIGAC